jgi:hypothetical protein
LDLKATITAEKIPLPENFFIIFKNIKSISISGTESIT